MKRLIVCCDGSWPSRRQDVSSSSSDRASSVAVVPPSNVARLSRMLDGHGATPHGDDAAAQIVYYQSGASSSSSPTPSWLLRGGRTLSAGIEDDIAAAYHFLATNYSPGTDGGGGGGSVAADEIFVFGASRGALVARAVVGLVTEMGLLRRERLGLWGRAWGLWAGRKGATAFWKEVVALKSAGELAEIEEVREGMWAMGVRVKVVGVWDTVSG